jgi:hypothetical protein
MSVLARYSSRLLTIVVSVGLGACIDAPRLSTADGTSTDGQAKGGGASAVSREHDGMVLVAALTLDTTGVAPVGNKWGNGNNDDEGNGNGNGNGNGKDKPPKGGGGGAPDAGGGGADAGGGAAPPGGGSSPPGSTPAPQSVVVPAFWIDSLEVTVASYRACLAAGACTAPADAPGCTLAESLDAHPVNCVTADQARVFCTWQSKRLVRNDEWSSAAAGAAHRVYPWGAESPAADRVNACGTECNPTGMYGASDGHVRTAPAGSFPLGVSPDGALDLAGNVAEWVDGTLAPVARGGSYADTDPGSISSMNVRTGAVVGPTVGFRCAADH